MTDALKNDQAGRPADETPGSNLVAEFHEEREPVAVLAVDGPDEDVVEAARLKAEADDRVAAPPPLLGRRRTPGTPPRLDSVPGFVDSFVFWVLDRAAREQPAIFQAVGLALLGALTGRQFQTRTGLRGNVFFLAIAGTGMGKDAPITAARQLAQAAECPKYIAGDPGSFRGFQRYLGNHPARFFPMDELGKSMLAAQRDPSSPQRAMLDFLLKLYSNSVAGGELPAHVIAKAAESTPAVPQACTSLTGFSTEEAWEALTPSAASDGWLPRFVLVEGNPDAPLRSGAFVPPPERLLAAARRIIQDLPGHDYGTDGHPRMRPDVAPRAFVLPEEPEVSRIDEDVRRESDAWVREARKAGRPWVGELVVRWRENGLKLAMLRAVSRWSMDPGVERPLLRAEDYLWGLALAEDSIRRMAQALASRVGANEHDLLTKRILRVIAGAGGIDGWAHRGAVRRALGGGRVNTRDFSAAMETLDDLGDVETQKSPARSKSGSGRPAEAYRLTPAGQRRLDS